VGCYAMLHFGEAASCEDITAISIWHILLAFRTLEGRLRRSLNGPRCFRFKKWPTIPAACIVVFEVF